MFTKLAFARQPSSDELHVLGRRAAKLHLEDGRDLTDAVAEMVKESNLSRHAVAHVARTANQETWRTLHHDQEDREAEFDPADPDAVLDRLGVSRERAVEAVHDYYGDPPGEELELDVDSIFGERQEDDTPLMHPKTASLNQLDREARLRNDAQYARDRALPVLHQAHADFYKEVKTTHLDEGVPLTKIAQVVQMIIDEPTFVAALMTKTAERMEAEGVRFDIVKEAAAKSTDEVMVPSLEHPLVKAASALQEAVLSHAASVAAHTRWNDEFHKRWRG